MRLDHTPKWQELLRTCKQITDDARAAKRQALALQVNINEYVDYEKLGAVEVPDKVQEADLGAAVTA